MSETSMQLSADVVAVLNGLHKAARREGVVALAKRGDPKSVAENARIQERANRVITFDFPPAAGKRGRKPLSPGLAKSLRLELRLSAEVYAALQGLADAAGVSRNTVVDQLVLDAWSKVQDLGPKFRNDGFGSIGLPELHEWFAADAAALGSMSDADYEEALATQRDAIAQMILQGIPFDKDIANAKGADYLGSLSDGSIVYWGAALRYGPGRSGQELWVHCPDGRKVLFAS